MLVIWCGALVAAESNEVVTPRTQVSLIADHDSVAPGQSFYIGLRQKLAPHWHTYWRNPGDAGSPPRVRLSLPEGVVAGDIIWPGPERIWTGPLVSYGYEREIVFPILLRIPETLASGDALVVEADADWVVCEKGCIPETGRFRLELPVSARGTPAVGEEAGALERALRRVPTLAPWTTRLRLGDAALELELTAEAGPADVGELVFLPDRWGVIEHSAPQSLQARDGRLVLEVERGPDVDPGDAVSGVIAATDAEGSTRWYAVSGAAEAMEGAGSAPVATAAIPWVSPWRAILFALLGGLILNLMPCVFPVLAIKAASLSGLSGQGLMAVRWSAVFYTAGVLLAFLALALLLLALKAGGAALGWGFQFQAPVFVALMSWLMVAIGLNLAGLYEFGAAVTGAGQGLAQKPGHLGSFFSGLLAVVLATPCSAPFLGTAMGAALAAPAPFALVLFFGMGLGLALPFALLAAFPGVAGWLPRPGLWMVRLREFLAFPMFATGAWLVWVLGKQVGDAGVAIGLGGALLVAFAVWLLGRGRGSSRVQAVARAAALLSVVLALALLPLLQTHQASGESADPQRLQPAEDSQPFSGQLLSELRAAGEPVFVNMTAAWCITCLLNERTSLSDAGVRQAMTAKGVRYLKGDWTHRDAEISAYLASFAREGVPFYAYYPAGGGEAVILPTLLTPDIVLAALEGGGGADKIINCSRGESPCLQ